MEEFKPFDTYNALETEENYSEPPSFAVDVSFADHLVDFLVGQLLAQVCHDVTKLGRRDVAVSVLVKYSKSVC